MKRLFRIALILGLAFAGGCDHAGKAGRQDVEAEKSWEDAASAFGKQYGALVDWEGQIPNRGSIDPLSIDVSRALVRSNGQPVLLVMELKDVEEGIEGYTALFKQFYWKPHSFILTVELKCTREQADNLLKRENDSYAIVARIDHASRLKVRVVGRESGEDSFVELENPADVFCANGMCLGLLRKGEGKPERQ
jgi:hypothetical protein